MCHAGPGARQATAGERDAALKCLTLGIRSLDLSGRCRPKWAARGQSAFRLLAAIWIVGLPVVVLQD